MSDRQPPALASEVDAIMPRDPGTEIVVPDFADDELAARLRSNPFIQRTGVFLEPFSPQDITTKYSITVLEIVRSRKGLEAREDLLDTIIRNHLPADYDREAFLKTLLNEHSWINGILHHLIRVYAGEVLQIDDYPRLVGRELVRQSFSVIIAARSVGVGFIYRNIVRANRNFNTYLDIEIDAERSSLGLSVIRYAFQDSYIKRVKSLYGDDLALAMFDNLDRSFGGTMEAIPKAVNPGNDYARLVEQPKSTSRGDPYSEFHLSWQPGGLERFAYGMRQALARIVGSVIRTHAVRSDKQ